MHYFSFYYITVSGGQQKIVSYEKSKKNIVQRYKTNIRNRLRCDTDFGIIRQRI